jgi:Fur family ferric uptake transcriptional regulator
MADAASSLADLCRSRGLRPSARRLIVLEVLGAAVDSPTLDEIYRRAVSRDRSICYTTIYRTVGDLVCAGMVTMLDGDGKPRYRRAVQGGYGVVIDMDSGAVVEFSSAELETAIATVLTVLGYELQSYRLRLVGRRKSGTHQDDGISVGIRETAAARSSS